MGKLLLPRSVFLRDRCVTSWEFIFYWEQGALAVRKWKKTHNSTT